MLINNIDTPLPRSEATWTVWQTLSAVRKSLICISVSGLMIPSPVSPVSPSLGSSCTLLVLASLVKEEKVPATLCCSEEAEYCTPAIEASWNTNHRSVLHCVDQSEVSIAVY